MDRSKITMDGAKIKMDKMTTEIGRTANTPSGSMKSWTENGRRDRPEFPSLWSECCSLTGMLCVLLCCGPCQRSMPWTLRVVPLCACVLFLAVLVVSLIQYGYHRDRSFQLSPTDIRTVAENLSSDFCSKYNVDSTGRFTAYMFDNEPVVNEDVTSHHTWTETVFVKGENPVEKSFYLLKGSTTKLKISPDYDLNFCAIKGKKAFEIWLKHKSFSACSQTGTIHNGKVQSIEMKSEYSEHIYFVLTVTASATWVDLTFTLDRTSYDVKSALEFCDVTQRCQFSMPFHSRNNIVVMSSLNGGTDTVIKTHCNPGIVFYIFISIIPAFTCVLLGIAFIYLVKQDANRKLDLDARLTAIARRPVGSHLKAKLFRCNMVHYQTFHNKSEIGKCLVLPKKPKTFGSYEEI